MCGGSGGGSSGETKYTWNDDLAPLWRHYLNFGQGLTDNGQGGLADYKPYTGQRIADLHPAQIQGLDRINSLANNGGTVLSKAADDQAYKTLGDQYLSGPDSNWYAKMGNKFAGMSNPFTNQENGYGGLDNPYFKQQLNSGLEDIAGNYEKGTSAETTRLMNMSGVLGGSAHRNAVQDNQSALGKQMSNFTSGMMNDQYNRSAGLEESYLNRGNQNMESQIGRMFGGEEARLGRGYGAYEGERGRQMQSIPFGSQNIADAMKLYQGQVGVGDSFRGYNQDILNQGYGDWQEQQNHPFKMLDYYTGLLSRAQGGMAPNSSMTTPGYQASPFSQLFGAGLLAKSAFGGS